jgi:cyclophilin family peptidyl-prolyl cis-trans isomerase
VSSTARLTALLLVALAAAGCEKKTAIDRLNEGAPKADAGDPIQLAVTVAKKTVALGDDIVFRVKLTNAGASRVSANLPRLDERSVSFRVRRPDPDGGIARVTRIHATQDPRTGRITPEPGDVKDLAPGESVEDDVQCVAVEAGKLTFTPSYVRFGAPAALVGDPIEIEVVPGDPKKPRLGVKLATSHGNYTAVFRPDAGYNTVESFASLAKRGFFSGLKFHRIIAQFMAQGGDPNGDGSGGPGYFLPLEASYPPKLPHRRGVISMARQGDPNIDTAGSQFFLMFATRTDLDRGRYTTFGEMVDGEETLQKLEKVPVTPSPQGEPSVPAEKVLIDHATLVELP